MDAERVVGEPDPVGKGCVSVAAGEDVGDAASSITVEGAGDADGEHVAVADVLDAGFH